MSIKDMEMHMEKIGELKTELVGCLKSEFAKGLSCIDTKEAGEVTDMIKDLAETERNCYEACYYKSIVEAMEDAEEGARYGYNPNRYSSGRYAPTGRGTRGYRPYEDLDMIDAWAKDLDDNGMGYRMGFNAGGRSGVKMSDGIRSGGSYMVDPDMYSEHSSNWDSRYGDAYNKYRASRKHYTESKSAADKLEMDEHANEHINDTIATMKEIYKSADPDMRKRMKENVQKLVSEMIV